MSCAVFNNLKEQIDRFRLWSDGYPIERRSGEWEVDYFHWNLLYHSFTEFLHNCPVQNWNHEVMENVIYITARDNEVEIMVSELAQDADRLLAVAKACLLSTENAAKWQVATRLERLSTHLQEAESLLLNFVEDKDEYVRRQAIMALGRIQSPHIEQLAEQAWNRDEDMQEYQRMAVLDALRNADSPLLKEYLVKAKEDGRQYLAAFSDEIKSNL
jgi:hypothetical protein